MKLKNSLSALTFILFFAACQASVQVPDAAGVASPEFVARSLATVNPEASLHLFDYDPDTPKDIQEQNHWHGGKATWIDFTYESPKGGPVEARLVIPDGKGPFPGMILQHGGGGRASLEDLTYQAQEFANYGAVVMMITDPYSRPGGWEPTAYMGNTWPLFTSRDLEIKIQTIIDLRRAIDILSERPEVDPERMAYYGVSYGGMLGGLLAGVENRLTAYVLVVGDGGLVEHTSDPGENGINIHFSQNWADLMWPTESLHFVGRAAPAALLFQNGIYDTYVPPHDAIRYQTAGSEPKTIIWYDTGHNLPWKHVIDAARWLQPYLGDRLFLLSPNYHASALWLERGLILLEITSLGVFLWLALRRPTPNRIDRLRWLPAVILLGPLGLVLYWIADRSKITSPDLLQPAKPWKTALKTGGITAISLMLGVLLGDQINDFFPADFRIRLILLYLSLVIIGWLLSHLNITAYQTNLPVYIPIANLAWSVVILNPQILHQLFNSPVWSIYMVEGSLIFILATIMIRVSLWLAQNQNSRDPDKIYQIQWTPISKFAAGVTIAISFILAFWSTVVMLQMVTGLGWREAVLLLRGVY